MWENSSNLHSSYLVDPHPFFAELPSGYNTGLIRQFIPRINATATFDALPDEKLYKEKCLPNGRALIWNYQDMREIEGGKPMWLLQACVPETSFAARWKPLREYQSFTEELYLNITHTFPEQQHFRRVVLNTAAGYFELPNAMNGGKPGSLLSADPETVCNHDCLPQKLEFSEEKQ
jgi:hypothetical protein